MTDMERSILQILESGEELEGSGISKAIREQYGWFKSLGLFIYLNNLKNDGLIQLRLEEQIINSGYLHRRTYYYQLTQTGEEVLHAEKRKRRN